MDTNRTETDGRDITADDTGDRDRRTTRIPDTDGRFVVPLRGVAVDSETRCAHWDSPVDVVALRFGCCEAYYPCDACHDAVTNHEAEPWPRNRFDESAALCGRCRATLPARVFLDADDACPCCGVAFNPGCRAHVDRYFEV
ncbi:CHY zinc finger protein [Halorubrum sp. BV1]|uniref:CHY zinc finger protein n=1 Tax=Halorubrum sp. BV1 TaxID=1498500 RepID=UPI0009B59CF6|nr:CHY zinc finger protein [Halorubrum sp. BV1]